MCSKNGQLKLEFKNMFMSEHGHHHQVMFANGLDMPAGRGPNAFELQPDVIPQRHPLSAVAATEYVGGHNSGGWRNMGKYEGKDT